MAPPYVSTAVGCVWSTDPAPAQSCTATIRSARMQPSPVPTARPHRQWAPLKAADPAHRSATPPAPCPYRESDPTPGDASATPAFMRYRIKRLDRRPKAAGGSDKVEPGVPVLDHLGASGHVPGEATGIRHVVPGLSRDVGAEVPRGAARMHLDRAGERVHVLGPLVLRH